MNAEDAVEPEEAPKKPNNVKLTDIQDLKRVYTELHLQRLDAGRRLQGAKDQVCFRQAEVDDLETQCADRRRNLNNLFNLWVSQ